VIYRIFPSKDTFITSARRYNVPQTGSNFGSCEIMHVFKQTAVTSSLSSSIARILTQFDLSSVPSVTASFMARSAVSYRLRLMDAQHDKTLPSSFDIEVQAVSQDWDEGIGFDVDYFSDKGFANWDKRKSNAFWSVPGASGSGPIVAAHFDSGHENLDVDVTPIVKAWMTGGLPNYGFLVKLSSSLESDSSDYYTKMFHARETSFGDKRPHLEASWDDSIRDDRNNFVFDHTCSLYLYNVVRGAPEDIPNPCVICGPVSLTVRIADASGTIMTVTGSYTGATGIYSASFSLPSGSYSGSTFNDIWFSGSHVFMTGTFVPAGCFAVTNDRQRAYFLNVTNLKDEYQSDEVPRFDVFMRNRDYNLAVLHTASSEPRGLVATVAYYRIDNDRTDAIVVPFGTGSVETTRLSYDDRGNFFDFHMGSLPTGNLYRIVFLIESGGRRQLIDNGFKFRTV
jgi:hypothetical protein